MNQKKKKGSASPDILQDAEKSMILLAGRYEILSTIKSGAMGNVFRARDTRLNCTVAVKKMIFTSSNPVEVQYAEERFMEEGRLLSELHHEGLPKVIDFFREADPETGQYSHYLVMTFIEGKRPRYTDAGERKEAPSPGGGPGLSQADSADPQISPFTDPACYLPGSETLQYHDRQGQGIPRRLRHRPHLRAPAERHGRRNAGLCRSRAVQRLCRAQKRSLLAGRGSPLYMHWK